MAETLIIPKSSDRAHVCAGTLRQSWFLTRYPPPLLTDWYRIVTIVKNRRKYGDGAMSVKGL